MQTVSDAIKQLYEQWKGQPAASVDLLPQSGSDRRYFRIHEADGGSVIATIGANTRENEVFIYFSNHFQTNELPTPKVFAVNDELTIYLQEDFGDVSLLNKLESLGLSDEVYSLFRQSLQQLARLQVTADEGLDYNQCLTNKEFGKQAIMADLLYFKYYFLDALRKPYDKQQLIDDFEALSSYLTHTEYKYFMFRDFQSRNIMVSEDNQVHFIDYQGGMKGAPQYDVASMLWQAKANLPDDWKNNLLTDYIDAFENIIGQPVDRSIFQSQYHGYVLIRLLQVLGAYGFRGLFERKAHFLASIPLALRNLRFFIENKQIGENTQEFDKMLKVVVGEDIIAKFETVKADENTPLVVK